MSLMPDTPREFVELFGLACAVVLVALFGWAVQIGVRLWLDGRRAAKQPPQGLSWESQLAADTPASPKPVKSRRSPFAPNRAPKQKETAK